MSTTDPAAEPLAAAPAALRAARDALRAAIGDDLEETTFTHGELTMVVASTALHDALHALRDDPDSPFSVLIDLCGVDTPSRLRRFEVVYHLLCMSANLRARLKIRLGEGDAAPSVVPIFPAAEWYEREAWDMYGVPFDGHPDLRRLLTDYGFEGHPLRKDFPLTGYVEVRYDEERKAVAYEPVSLPQEMRDFDFLSPWEGMNRPQRAEDEGDQPT